jgi:hypothetical protein
MKKNVILTSLLTAGIALTAHAQNVFIDLGVSDTQTSGNWNNFTSPYDLTTVTDLIDFDTGLDSGIDFQITQGFYSTHTGGENVAVGEFDATAVQDSFYVDSASSRSVAIITFTGLDDSTEYEFTFVSSYAADDDRYALITVTGLTTQTITISSDSSEYSIDSVFSSEETVTVQFEVDPSSSSTTAFLNSIQLVSIPEPSTYAALLGFTVMGFALVRRRR